MLENNRPEKVDIHLGYDPASFGPVNSLDDIIDVYLQTDFGVAHFGASKEITEKQKQEVVDQINNSFGKVLKQVNEKLN
ncbi:hypothetical protein [Fructobacillus cardui]|uniref:Uncharacterized protein n=1 Tax=Fructobacillus cardui TaxID=2893170 RepID=A0ABN9Z373_9LACO|nr:unnamed protein product [Fructobacillus cardui]